MSGGSVDGCSRDLWGGGDGFAAGDGYFFNGAEKVFRCGMGEAIAEEVGAHGFVHGVAADEAFESGEQGGGFAVGDAAVGFGVAEFEGPASDWIVIGGQEILDAL